MKAVLAIVMVAACAACAAGPRTAGRSEPPPQRADFAHDSALFELLASPPSADRVDSLRQLEQRTGLALADTLADIAEESTVHPVLRANAIAILGRLRTPRHLIVIQPLLEDPDERIRLAAVGAAREFLAVRPESAMRLLSIAAMDSSLAVQARTLEAVTDRDVELLRAWMRRGPAPALEPVLQQMIAVAEERGAPLEPDTATRVLVRRGPNGGTLRFRPAQEWPQWQIAVGRLELQNARGTITLGERVEVVRNVIPAFFSRDGEFLVYEEQREIFVVDMATAAKRGVGPGLAPRALPFTDDFAYARLVPDSATELRSGARLEYELVRGAFAPSTSSESGVLTRIAVNISFDVAGGASPLRWMRIRETADGSGFELAGPGIATVPLPGLLPAVVKSP
jgi:hypothetical protein